MIKRIIVTGGRDRKFEERALVWDTLDKYRRDEYLELVVQGGAEGVDNLAKLWCFNNGVPCATVEAQWKFYGKFRAGPMRNIWMASLFNADVVLAFPGGKGTANMIEQAISESIPVVRFEDK